MPGDGRRRRREGQCGSTAANLRVSRDSMDGRARLFWKPPKRQMLVVPAIPILGKPRHENCELEVSLDYIERLAWAT